MQPNEKDPHVKKDAGSFCRKETLYRVRQYSPLQQERIGFMLKLISLSLIFTILSFYAHFPPVSAQVTHRGNEVFVHVDGIRVLPADLFSMRAPVSGQVFWSKNGH